MSRTTAETAVTTLHPPAVPGLGTDPVALLSSAQRRVLELLDPADEPVSIQHLSEISGHHPNTLREHLQALTDLGLVRTVNGKPGGRGRPPLLYQALPLDHARPESRAYGILTAALVEQVLRTSSNPAHDAIAAGRRVGIQLAESGEITGHPDDTPLDTLARLLTHLGFAPRTENDRVEIGVCPFIRIAKETPEVVCGVHQGIISGYLGATGITDTPRLHPFGPDNPCEVTLDPAPPHHVSRPAPPRQPPRLLTTADERWCPAPGARHP